MLLMRAAKLVALFHEEQKTGRKDPEMCAHRHSPWYARVQAFVQKLQPCKRENRGALVFLS